MKVPVGPATIVGYALTALGAAGAALAASEGQTAGAGQWLAILAVVSGLVTNVGRQLQAGKPVAEAIQDVIDPALGISTADVSNVAPKDADTQGAGMPRATL